MTPIEIRKMAEEQIALKELAGMAAPPSVRLPAFDLSAAYGIAGEIVRIRRARGERTVGRKIGFTNRAIWTQYGLDTPIWAHMYEGTVRFAAGDRISLSLAGLVAPKIEPEIVFKFRSAPADSDQRSLLSSIEWLAAGYEIVDCHYPGWNFQPADTVVDFGLHAALVVGTPKTLVGRQDDSLPRCLEEFRITLLCDGKEEASGEGSAVLGGPLSALAYLRDLLREQKAEALSADEVVTTGTLTAALPVKPGQTWSTNLQGIDLRPPLLKLL